MIIPLLAGAGLLWLLLSSGKPAPAPAPTPTPPPAPPPGPTPVEIATLRANVLGLLRLADVAPDSVDPNAMDAAADHLDQVGLHDEATAVRMKALALRARKQVPPPAADVPRQPEPRPQTPQGQPGQLPDGLATRANAILSATQGEPVAALVLVDNIERRFGQGSFFDTVSKLRAKAKEFHTQRATVGEAIELSQVAASNPEKTSPSVLEMVAADVAIVPSAAAALRRRAAEMRAQGLGIVIPD